MESNLWLTNSSLNIFYPSSKPVICKEGQILDYDMNSELKGFALHYTFTEEEKKN